MSDKQILEATASQSPKWYVVDHDKDDAVVRGPFANATTAAEIRKELERHGDEERNLWIVPDRLSTTGHREAVASEVKP